MEPELTASYRSAEAVARRRSNFYYSFLVLPSEKRHAFCAVYAFMRYCDDISDGTGGKEQKRRQLREWRTHLETDAHQPAGADGSRNSPILPAFHDTMRRYSIPEQYFHWIIDGAEMDLGSVRYETFQDLYSYCFHVASAVGLVCLQLFGYRDERAKKLAEDCGIAFQLTNILRDIKEDADQGRIYLPMEDLRQFGYSTDDLLQGVFDDRFRKLMRFEVERARSYYMTARNLLSFVDAESRPALWAMIEIYETLLEGIVRNEYNVFDHRVGLSGSDKVSILLKALVMRLKTKAGVWKSDARG
jgi:15-cis-phytoene synthase